MKVAHRHTGRLQEREENKVVIVYIDDYRFYFLP
jgi:hypothetical protein